MKPTETLQPLTALRRLHDMATGYLVSQILFTACRLGVFEQLAQQTATAEELAQRLELHSDGCRRLLGALAQYDLIECVEGRYRNSALGGFLTAHAAVPLAPLTLWGEAFYRMWEYLPGAVRECEPRYREAFGTTFEETFANAYAESAQVRRWAELMQAYSAPEGAALARQFDCAPFHCVLDVAGGNGALSLQLGLAHPHLRGIVMDLPPVCPLAKQNIAAHGLAKRFTTQAVDMFAGPYPAGADLITLVELF